MTFSVQEYSCLLFQLQWSSLFFVSNNIYLCSTQKLNSVIFLYSSTVFMLLHVEKTNKQTTTMFWIGLLIKRRKVTNLNLYHFWVGAGQPIRHSLQEALFVHSQPKGFLINSGESQVKFLCLFHLICRGYVYITETKIWLKQMGLDVTWISSFLSCWNIILCEKAWQTSALYCNTLHSFFKQ